MTYEEALKQSKEVGASRVSGMPHLAMTVASLAIAHAINPQLVYTGAINRGLTAKQVRRLDAVALGNLMFD